MAYFFAALAPASTCVAVAGVVCSGATVTCTTGVVRPLCLVMLSYIHPKKGPLVFNPREGNSKGNITALINTNGVCQLILIAIYINCISININDIFIWFVVLKPYLRRFRLAVLCFKRLVLKKSVVVHVCQDLVFSAIF